MRKGTTMRSGQTEDVWTLGTTLGLVALGLWGTLVLESVAPVFASALAGTAFWLGRWQAQAQGTASRRFNYRIADELVQYRVFTRLLRDQNARVCATSEEATLSLALGLRQMSDQLETLAQHIRSGADPTVVLAEIEALGEPLSELLGRLQFQDITQQQLMFLSRLSVLLDDHIAELLHVLGDRRSLERTTRFKELFDKAFEHTVMASQRHDHSVAVGLSPLDAPLGQVVELFDAEEHA